MTIPSEQQGPLRTSCSDGGRHEHLQPVPPPELRAGCARTAANPARARTRRARPARPARILREEILAVIGKHVPFERDNVQIRMDRGEVVSTLEVDIEIPNGLPISAEVVVRRRDTEGRSRPPSKGYRSPAPAGRQALP